MNEQDKSGGEFLIGCVPLAVGDTLRLVDPQAVLVYVAQGHIWITEERGHTDVVVGAEHWHRLMLPGAAVVEALAPSVLLLTAPQATGWARSLTTSSRPPLPRASRRSAYGGRNAWAWLRAAWRRPALVLHTLVARSTLRSA